MHMCEDSWNITTGVMGFRVTNARKRKSNVKLPLWSHTQRFTYAHNYVYYIFMILLLLLLRILRVPSKWFINNYYGAINKEVFRFKNSCQKFFLQNLSNYTSDPIDKICFYEYYKQKKIIQRTNVGKSLLSAGA